MQKTLLEPEGRITTRETPRLSAILFNSMGFDSFAAVPSNCEAVETSLLFATGLQSFAAIVGPSGWGKTHLLEAVARRLQHEAGHWACEVHSASDWVLNPPRVDPHVPVVLDNVQDVLSRARSRLLLRLALERRVKAGRPTILGFTSPKPGRTIRTLLPQAREWTVATIGAPASSERQVIVTTIARSEGLSLSDELIRLLAGKLRGNGLTIRGAMKRLKLQQSHWLTADETLRACGLLNPFFSDNSSWDLREHIMDHARASGMRCGIAPDELATYVMLRQALLSEADVARYLNVEPGRAYATATKVDAKLGKCEDGTAFVRDFIASTVASLQKD